MKKPQTFSPFNVPLDGSQLIEASAGTGKTYTITSLFLRLILERPDMDVRRILVVTFTEAATGELRDRVRSRLRGALDAFQAGAAPADDAFLQELLARHNRDAAVGLLTSAIADFDEAAIFTIHGFCQRVLRDLAFEAGGLFDTELISSQDDLIQRAVDDFWRKNIYSQSRLFTDYCLQTGLTADSLYSLVSRHVSKPELVIVPLETMVDFGRTEQAFVQALPGIRSLWEKSKNEIQEILSTSPGLNHSKYRKDYVGGWASQLDAWLADKNPHLPLTKNAARFTNQALQTAETKKPLPQHPFFDAFSDVYASAQELEDLYRRQVLAIKATAFEQVRRELELRKQAQNIQYFDDLLLRVYRGLMGSEGRSLAAAVRARFAAALIDEFQDTDPVQYAIFEKIFRHPDAALFLIGDPKQAIYSFRSADIFTYLDAVGQVKTRHLLSTNWRSDPQLISAVNALFGRHANPFLFEKITFTDAVSERMMETPATPPFELWFVPEAQHTDLRITKLRRGIACCVANEIVHLIANDEKPGHMAVLVRTHHEAAIVQHELALRRVPSIRQSTETIFDTPEAAELELVLRAVATPGSEGRLRAALATVLLGYGAEKLTQLLQDSPSHEAELTSFNSLHDLWLQQGCFAMLRQLLVERSVLERLIALPAGERRVTNILHLAEVLHRQELQTAPGIDGLVQWLACQRNPDTPCLDEHQLRLESDEDAVKIVTIHKSKGLEYPIVFCPYAWSGGKANNQQALFHDPDNGLRLTLDIGSKRFDEHKKIAARETLAEDLRLLYVSLTRAKRRCYMVWGNFDKACSSAPAYLFHGAGIDPTGDTPAQMMELFTRLTDEDMRQELEAIANKSGGAIAVRDLKLGAAVHQDTSAVPQPQAQLVKPLFSGTISRQWRIASFSSLIAGRPHEQEFPQTDEFSTPPAPSSAQEAGSMFSLPGGSRIGTMLHEILEKTDFADPAGRFTQGLVQEKLSQYGLEPRWEGVISRMLADVAAVSLQGESSSCSLGGIDRSAQLHELGFYFPLRSMSKNNLAGLFADAGFPAFTGVIEELVFSPVAGYMNGFIDLIFCHDERFYIIDWKSNFLGAAPADYAPGRLMQAMRDNFYFLQYHLYTLALHLYLTLRLPGYEYAQHFGGVFYVFLRGLSKDAPGQGIFYDRPSYDLIRKMNEGLIQSKPD
ncbi:MAG: exodeoxyribonuclease V subunit beta [Deltaproteobacteria bacterium]|nr:exodeoxyribonuclease V subunit beta [Deltaproteobacteria bacterium]